LFKTAVMVHYTLNGNLTEEQVNQSSHMTVQNHHFRGVEGRGGGGGYLMVLPVAKIVHQMNEISGALME
jgi:hypothetical protein